MKSDHFFQHMMGFVTINSPDIMVTNAQWKRIKSLIDDVNTDEPSSKPAINFATWMDGFTQSMPGERMITPLQWQTIQKQLMKCYLLSHQKKVERLGEYDDFTPMNLGKHPGGYSES